MAVRNRRNTSPTLDPTIRARPSAKKQITQAIAEDLESRLLYSTVAVNVANVHQTVSGIGGDYAVGTITGQFSGVAQDPVGETTLQFLSPTVARVGLPLPQWAPTNDNGQGSPTWSGYNSSGVVQNDLVLLQELQSKGITITLSTWDIPNWMCSNPTATGGRQLAPNMYGAFANAVGSFISLAKSQYGVNISYFSVNEADGGYNVLLTSAQEASLIQTVGAKFQSLGLTTKWLVGDTYETADAVPFITPILQTPGVLQYVGAISYHTWWSDSLPASSYSSIAALGQQYNLPVFATEVGDQGGNATTDTTSYAYATELAAMYYNILGPGEVNAAMDWEFQNDFPVASATTGQLYPVFYVLQQMGNTFTPGTQIVDSSSTDSTLLPLAALNPQTGNLSLQVQNTGSVDEQVTLTGMPAGTYNFIFTSPTQNEVSNGIVTVGSNGTATVTLPADSLSTLTKNKLWATGDVAPTATVTLGKQLAGTPSSNTTSSTPGNGVTNVVDGNTSTYFDSTLPSGNWVQLDLGSPQTIGAIQYAPRVGDESIMEGGLFEVSNDPTFTTGVVTLGEIYYSPADGLTTLPANLSGTYRYVRYVSPNNSYGDIAELQVFAPPATGSTITTGPTLPPTAYTGGTTTWATIPTAPVTVGAQLTGTPSASTTASYNNLGTTFANAFDNTPTTYFDAPNLNGNWIQLDLGSPQTITQIQYAPRDQYAYRMLGGVIEVSNDPTFTTGVVALPTITTTPAAGFNAIPVSFSQQYRYVRYVSPDGSQGDIAELDVYGNTPVTTGGGSTGAGGVELPLTGTPTASTALSYGSSGDTFQNVFDGNTNTYFDSPDASGNWVQLDFGLPQTITEIQYAPRVGFESRMVGGIFEASNNPTFINNVVVLGTITAAPADGLNVLPVSVTGTYEYVRYYAPDNSYGNVAEIQVFSPDPVAIKLGTQLTGTPSSNITTSYNNSGNTFANAFDGNINTFFDAPYPNGVWIQLDLGSPQTITQIEYAPRAGDESRMIGGVFEASNDPTFTNGVVTLGTITTAPADGYTVMQLSLTGTYEYVRYLAPDNGWGNIAEMQVYGIPTLAPPPPTLTGSQLTGTPSANTTSSWNNSGNTFANVFDGNTATFFDAPNPDGNWVQLDLGSADTITQIQYAPRVGYESRMIGGVFEASNDPTFTANVVTLGTITAAPADGLTILPVTATGTYRYVRYVAPDNSSGNIAEMQVYGVPPTGGSTPITVGPKLVGTPSANTTSSWNNSGNTFQNVFDGNTSTFFDAPNPSGDWVQLAFASPQTITEIQYAPRVGYESRMIGGVFEASNDPTFTTGVVTLGTITAAPADGLNVLPVTVTGTYEYVRYVAPNNSSGNIAELQVFGPATTA
jgi:O-glycosyl hydrolase